MNPRTVHVALVIGGLAAAAFIAFLLFMGACASTPFMEPAWSETVARDR